MKRTAFFGIAGLFVLALIGVAYAHFHPVSRLLSSITNTDSRTASAATAKTPATIRPENEAAEDSSENKATPQGKTNSQMPAATQQKSSTSPIPYTSRCSQDMERMEQDYHDELAKDKKNLDDELSIQYGPNINSSIISTYNKTVTDLYQEYVDKAKAEGCTCPIQAPTLLSDDYAPLSVSTDSGPLSVGL